MTHTVLTAEFSHETNTFSILPTDYAAFAGRSILFGDEAVAERRHSNTDIAGFMDVAEARGWKVLHALSTSAPPGGRVTRDAFERLTAPILALAVEQLGNLDGILLGLHGAMVPDFCEDGEGEFLARLRAIVGPALPVAITLDPHANVTRQMCDLANIIVSYKTYPHVDIRETGRHAAGVLHRAMTGEIRPVTIRAHRPMLEEVNSGRTDIGPMIARLERARAYEAKPDVFAVSINAGFGHSDIAEVGPTVLVTGEGDLSAHQGFAESIADDIWQRRFEVQNDYLSVEAAAAICLAHDGKGGPIVVADYADNPGGGAYGDGTSLLKALLDQRVSKACLGPMIDPEAVSVLSRHQPGDTVTLALGGKTDPAIGGGPLTLTGTLKLLSEGNYVGDGPMIGGLKKRYGPTAVLAVNGIDILIVSLSAQLLDQQQFKAFGITLADKSVIALKSMQHFRAAFEPIAARIIVCDSGALCTPRLKVLPYRNVPRPVFPLDQQS